MFKCVETSAIGNPSPCITAQDINVDINKACKYYYLYTMLNITHMPHAAHRHAQAHLPSVEKYFNSNYAQ